MHEVPVHLGSPPLHPRMLETPSDIGVPTAAPRKPQKMKKEHAFDEDEELNAEKESFGSVTTKIEKLEPTTGTIIPEEPPKATPRVLGPKPALAEKPKILLGSRSSNALITKKMPPLQKTQSASNVLESKLRDDFEFHSISRWENVSQINVGEEDSEDSTETGIKEETEEDLREESSDEDDGGITMSSGDGLGLLTFKAKWERGAYKRTSNYVNNA